MYLDLRIVLAIHLDHSTTPLSSSGTCGHTTMCVPYYLLLAKVLVTQYQLVILVDVDNTSSSPYTTDSLWNTTPCMRQVVLLRSRSGAIHVILQYSSPYGIWTVTPMLWSMYLGPASDSRPIEQ